MAQQYIMQLEGVTKVYEQKEILKDIWLSFFPGAKIGVLGANGAGKSTLLKIMSGEDTSFSGEARPAKGIKIGYFKQEPDLNPDQTVEACIAEAVAESQAILDRYNEVNMKFAEDPTPEEMEKLIEEQASLQDQIDANNLWVRCGFRPETPSSVPCPGANSGVWLSVKSCCRTPTCCF